MNTTSSKYWKNIKTATSSLYSGLCHTVSHIKQAFTQRQAIGIEQQNYFEVQNGLSTVLYPHESLPVPDNGRYRLHNEIDDCIVCDKCVKVCPVDCIDIEPIRATAEIGKTSDGTTMRIHAAKFDIDMGKCCFCGLCTTVCPTECLTMTKAYDFSEFDVKAHTYAFAKMTAQQIEEKKKELEVFNLKKQSETTGQSTSITAKSKTGKPVFKPKVKVAPENTELPTTSNKESAVKKKPNVKAKPIIKSEEAPEPKKQKPIMKPRIHPVIKPKKDKEE